MWHRESNFVRATVGRVEATDSPTDSAASECARYYGTIFHTFTTMAACLLPRGRPRSISPSPSSKFSAEAIPPQEDQEEPTTPRTLLRKELLEIRSGKCGRRQNICYCGKEHNHTSRRFRLDPTAERMCGSSPEDMTTEFAWQFTPSFPHLFYLRNLHQRSSSRHCSRCVYVRVNVPA